MSISLKALGLDQLGVDERLELVEEIMASLEEDDEAPSLTTSQKAELDRRLAAYEQNPDDVIPMGEVTPAQAATVVLPSPWPRP